MKNSSMIIILAIAAFVSAQEPKNTAADTAGVQKNFVSAVPASLETVLQGTQEPSTVFTGVQAKKASTARTDAVNVVVKKKVKMSGFDRFLDMWR
jgi:hypothetical protein